MVAVISTMQKDGLPVVVTPETLQPTSGKKHVILTSWASVTTALLMVVLIGGAFYVADLKKSKECSPVPSSEHHTKDYSRTFEQNGKTTREDFHYDEDEQSELMVKKSDDGNIEMISATDYKRKISATYIPSVDACVLLAGDDMDWTADLDVEKNGTIEVDGDEVDFKVTGNKVTDLSILPKEIKPYCQGKPTYWLQPADGSDRTEMEEGGTHQRHKRRVCFDGGLYKETCTYRFLWWKWRARCFWVQVGYCGEL